MRKAFNFWKIERDLKNIKEGQFVGLFNGILVKLISGFSNLTFSSAKI
jgi:hypothetical protein